MNTARYKKKDPKEKTMARKAEYVKDVEVIDPETDDYISMEIWRDPGTGKLFALESDFVEIASGANAGSVMLNCPYSNTKLYLEPV